MRKIWLRIMAALKRRQLDRDLADELQFHLEMKMQEGLDECAALRRIGNLARLKESCRELWSLGLIEIWWQDLRYSLRMLRKNPAFTVVAVATLALGIGATTAVFSVVNAVLLRAFPYKDSERLVYLFRDNPSSNPGNPGVAVPRFEDWRSQSRSFEDLAFYHHSDGILVDDGRDSEAENADYASVSESFFSILGVEPERGRSLSEEDHALGQRVVVIGHELWQRRYHGAPDIIDKKLNIAGVDLQVIGVMPREFGFPAREIQLWAPASASTEWSRQKARQGGRWARVFGKLKGSSDLLQAQAEMTTIAARIAQEYPATNAGDRIQVVPLQTEINGKSVPFMLGILLWAVSLVLLIACTNVASLLLARGAAREREFAVRTALGAGRLRLIRQTLTESTVLSVLSGSVGLLLAEWGLRILLLLAPRNIPRLDDVSIDARVLTFTFAVSVLAGILFGLAPAARLWINPGGKSLGLGHRIVSQGPLLRNMRGALIVAEFMLAMTLLTGAGLLIRSLLAVRAVDSGFQAHNALTLRLIFHNTLRRDQRVNRYQESMKNIAELPGVEAVGGVSTMFWQGEDANFAFRAVEGQPPEPPERRSPLVWSSVGGDYFKAIGVPLLRGRFFTDRDVIGTPPVAIVNESMSRRYWPGQDPVGKRVKGFDARGQNDDWVTVVGLVKDVRSRGRERQPMAQIYECQQQSQDETERLVIRTSTEPAQLAAAVRNTIHVVDKTAVVMDIATIEQQLEEQTSQRRFETLLLGSFSAIALLLAAVGIYGLMHYSVAQRKQEIGIRMALGAKSSNVAGMVVKEGLSLAGIGVGLGLLGGLAATRTISSLLFGVTPTDPATFAGVAVLLTAVALLACYIPARRAAKVDPLIALRHE